MRRARVPGSTRKGDEFSAGTYSRSGNELKLTDAGTSREIMGAIQDDMILFDVAGHEYRFARWRPEIVGQYHLGGCVDLEGGSTSCPEFVLTAPDGTPSTVVGGGLRIGLDEPGRYRWNLILRQAPGGEPKKTGSLFSSGTYAFDQETLTIVLQDSSRVPATMTGSLTPNGGGLSIVVGARQYRFGKLVLLPHGD
jgi:hypothetical protein